MQTLVNDVSHGAVLAEETATDMATDTVRTALSEKQETPLSSTERLIKLFASTRKDSLRIAALMSPEDAQLQSMPDASPAKWHLAHTTWFFETFILKAFVPAYPEFNTHFVVLFNSYYNSIGDQFTRAERGLLSRPSLDEVYQYRRYVDDHLSGYLLEHCKSEKLSRTSEHELLWLLTLGIQHEKQHQELMLMDIKHAFYQNPMFPPLAPFNENQNTIPSKKNESSDLTWTEFPAGLRSLGVNSSFSVADNSLVDTFSFEGFSFDNENPEHKRYVESFRIADRPVTNGEYLAFIEDSGYQRSEFWLADGWAFVCENHLQAPLYWKFIDNQWMIFSLHGLLELNPNQAVCHLSYYEAVAFANWSSKRLPTEFEWEIAAKEASLIAIKNNTKAPQFNNLVNFEPAAVSKEVLSDMLGGVWEWTSSNYAAYPRFKPFSGNAGEYNGKFMSGQFVLRGGACVSPQKHIRNTYRNFFYPHQRWAFSGLRLAEDCAEY